MDVKISLRQKDTSLRKGKRTKGDSCYSGKKLVTQCAKGGRVGEWDTYKDNPGSAPEATNDNALCYKNGDYFDPSQNY